jgi:hypothetical protein
MSREVHGPTHRRLAKVIRRHANADSSTRCWRCGLTLAEHEPHRNGKRPQWMAGHRRHGIVDAQLTLLDLAPEASTCNTSEGASWGNSQRAEAISADWR